MDKGIARVFGQNVKRLRESIGYSQEQLADKVECHRNYIGYIERGERNITLLKVVLLAQALKCSYEDLFSGVGPNQTIE